MARKNIDLEQELSDDRENYEPGPEPAPVAVAPPAATCTVKLNEPGFVGVPLISPLLVNGEKPGGRDPLASDHVYDPVPPLAASVAE